jgi:PAS domain S-box-containing protein
MALEIARDLLDASLDGVAAFDLDCRYIYWNAVMERVYGIREDEAIEQNAFDLFPFLIETGQDHCFRKALQGERVTSSDQRYTIPLTSRSGYAESTYAPLRDDRGVIIGGVVIVRDITERRQVEERAKEVESRFYRMADSSPVLLWMAGTDGLCNFFNQTWLTFTGRTLEQEHGVGWAEGVHPFDFQLCMDTYIDAFNARRPFEMEYRLRRADGEFRWILDRGAPRHDADGTFAGFIGSCTDITERKALETALQDALIKAEAASRLKSEFLANVSHELRTPLNAIVNVPLSTLRDFPVSAVWECPKCGEAFKRTNEDPDLDTLDACPDCKVEMSLRNRPFYVGDSRKTVHFLERMVQSGQHLLKMVSDVLEFSKIDAGRARLYLSEVSVASLLDEVSQTLAPLAEEKGVKVSYPSLEEPITLMADGVKLVQVFINLVSNAIQFTPPGGSVTVSAALDLHEGAEHVRFVVKDTGSGIPADKLDAIFESFRQADGSHTRAHRGTGLGLTITRQLIELHEGSIQVESQVGVGSKFTFVIPRDSAPAPETAAAEPRERGPQGKVLVIDDDPADLDLARFVLEREGFEVTLLDRSSTAAEAVQAERPDCIILDIVMPDMSGLTLLRRFKENDATSATPVLVTTAYSGNREVVQRLGGVWVPKPWSSDDLVAKVKKHVGEDRRRREKLAARLEGS